MWNGNRALRPNGRGKAHFVFSQFQSLVVVPFPAATEAFLRRGGGRSVGGSGAGGGRPLSAVHGLSLSRPHGGRKAIVHQRVRLARVPLK